MKIRGGFPCYVYFNSENCSGGGECIKCCPTKAIRIKQGKSIHLVDNCIGCGECISVCPLGCITPATAPVDSYKGMDKIPIVFVAPVLYSQFPGIHPHDVLKGLRYMGFRHAVDMSWFFERYMHRTREYILEKRAGGNLDFPVLSAMCPVVLRLIAFRFPDLIDNLNPMMRPVSVLVKYALSCIARFHNVALKALSVFYLNPCPTKMDRKKSAFFCEAPYTSRAIGINHIYPALKQSICEIMASGDEFSYEKRFEFESPPSLNGLLLGLSGGESQGVTIEKTLSISGMKETIAYLEKIEMGLFADFDFIEFRSCREGCVGGSLCAIDKYVAKNALHNMGLIQCVENTPIRKNAAKIQESKLFSAHIVSRKEMSQKMERIFGQTKHPLSIAELTAIDKLFKRLPGYNCTACGAPDCETFAEDVIRGRADIEACRLLNVI